MLAGFPQRTMIPRDFLLSISLASAAAAAFLAAVFCNGRVSVICLHGLFPRCKTPDLPTASSVRFSSAMATARAAAKLLFLLLLSSSSQTKVVS